MIRLAQGNRVRRRWFLAVLIGGVGIGWYLNRPDEEAALYEMATVTRAPLTQAVTASGQLNPVVKVEHRFRDGDPVDACAICRTEILQPVSFPGQLQLRVMRRDRWIVNDYGVVRAAPDRDQIFDEFIHSPADD